MKQNFLFAAMLLTALGATAQNNRFWTPVRFADATAASKANQVFNGSFKPASYNLYNLNASALRNVLWTAPLIHSVDPTKSSPIISVPLANGRIERFSVAEAPVMENQLATRYSNIKSFTAQGIDDPAAILRCSYSPEGFFGVIHSPNHKTVYINCIDKASQLYAVFERSDNDLVSNNFKCTLDQSIIQNAPKDKITYEGSADDGILRQYRLALCVTGEFSQTFTIGSESHQDSLNQVMAAITTDLVRANAVYEPEFDITMVFVNNEDTLIFLNPATDPFTLSNLNSKCQSTCDSRIGSTNYDIGHVLAKGSDNGNAGCIGCVCSSGSKGSGATTYHDPTLVDYMVIDYWTHEMGHQYGANHTFTFETEGTNAQIEPGSGSTIMGYAGITGSTDVQPHSDDYFSCASIAQVSNYVKSSTQGGKCAVDFPTGDAIPTAAGGKNYTIPESTPFALLGAGTDGDASDVLTYDWEQTDVYQKGSSNTFPKATSTTGPVFRSILPTTSPVRDFPNLATILTGATGNEWEQLSSVTRDLNMRLTVRDNHLGGGSNKSDDLVIKVTSTAGPFVVTSPNTNVSYAGNSQQTVIWNVANTTATPVSCANVKIILSADGGQTFPYVLAAKTANDGSQTVTIPNIATTQARIEVAALKNVFFDISDQNFTITNDAIAARDLAENAFTDWSIQPNPAQNVIQVLFNESAENALITLTDESGRMVYSTIRKEITNGESMSIDAHTFSNGVYFLQIKSGNDIHAEKVILNK